MDAQLRTGAVAGILGAIGGLAAALMSSPLFGLLAAISAGVAAATCFAVDSRMRAQERELRRTSRLLVATRADHEVVRER